MLACKVHHLGNFRLGNFERVDPTHADTLLMDVQHDSRRLFAPLVEEALKDVNHELHGRVVVVEQQHLVERWLLGFGFRLGDDARLPVVAI